MGKRDESTTPWNRRRAVPGSALGGAGVMLALAVVSSLLMGVWPASVSSRRTMWTFARMHALVYEPAIAEWNARSTPEFDLRVFGQTALQQRMLSSFFGELPSADLIEAERRSAARAFTGPLEAVGFVDLTEYLQRDGLIGTINAPSFGPWTSRGRIFGIPHDVHPVMLGYRADLVEAAGIDVSGIETWDDLFSRFAPLMADADGDGRSDRYLLNMWKTHDDHFEALLLQAGGGFFDPDGSIVIDSDINATVLATIASWCVGKSRVCADAPNFTAGGNKLKLDGYVVCNLMPDWMGDVWKHEIPQLAGKVKLMPLPAWERGGRRTSVWGGTMLGIPKTAARSPEDFEQLWSFAKHLYVSPDMARALFEAGGIITPVTSFWSDPIFDRPNPYFAGQPVGRMYIDLAPSVPARTSSPYNTMALQRVMTAFGRLCDDAEREGLHDVPALQARARAYLREAHASVKEQMSRNVFLRPAEVSP